MIRDLSHNTLTVLAASIALGIGACGSGEPETPPPSPPPAADAQEAPEAPAVESMQEMVEDAAIEAMGQAEEAAAEVMGQAAEVMEAATMPGAVVPADDGNPCTLSIQAGDALAYSRTEMSVPSSCGEVSVTLTHTGKLPAAAMGHNWVLMPADALESVATAGMSAGVEGNYIPSGDDRIVASTRLVAGGESDSITFSLDALDAGTSYIYACTFPGHWSVMRGTFTVM